MASKYKIGDRFVEKNTRDRVPIEIISIVDGPYEYVYELKPIRFCGNNVTLGEEGLDKLYNKI